MKLYKIIHSVIPTMWNRPCKIAIFADGSRVKKVFQKDFTGWWRNRNLERYCTVAALEEAVRKIDDEGKRRAAIWEKQKLANKTTN